jgi:quercetin dioxygenase-like cupin family protein
MTSPTRSEHTHGVVATDPYWLLSYAVRVLIDGDVTDGRFSLVEYLKPPGDGTPLHVHHHESQTTVVLEGEATVHLPDGPHVLGPGDWVHQPAAVPHCEVVGAEQPARVLDIYSPGGFERWVTLAGRRAAAMTLPPSPERLTGDRKAELTAIAAGLGIKLLGPPGTLPYGDG